MIKKTSADKLLAEVGITNHFNLEAKPLIAIMSGLVFMSYFTPSALPRNTALSPTN